MAEATPLYPAVAPHATGMMETGDGHSIYWERSGTPGGRPAVFLHGGPGSGISAWYHSLYDPEIYDVIVFDQRGCGKSTPAASLENNTTAHLIEDIEKLREMLGAESWTVGGGSWGATLALAYADAHPARCDALLLYGIFLARAEELRDLYGPGGVASRVLADSYAPFIALVPEEGRGAPISAYRDMLGSGDATVRARALEAWNRLEKSASCLVVAPEELAADMHDPDGHLLRRAQIECHYFVNNGFIDGNALLARIGAKVKDIPVHIVQGRYDMTCPFVTAWELHKAVPHSKLHIVPDGGHAASRTPAVQRTLVKILDALGAETFKKEKKHGG